ncbi:MAG: lipopolysaccharide heptosyltransferase II [Planctomycetes bacterium]|nr:lipopolysaccharide heptosyltransferase II [Planctomycetota bacterium]
MTLAVALPNWVGDAVMATPALRALRRRFPHERIVGVLRPYVRPVLEPNPWIDGYIECGRSSADFKRAAAAMRRQRAEAGVLLPNSVRSALLFWMGRVRRRIGYERGGRGVLLTDRLKAPREGGRFVPRPMISYYLRLVEVLGADASDRRMELFTADADESAAVAACAAAGIDPARTVFFCPGYAFGPAKGWPAEHWAALAAAVRERFGLAPAILCSPAEAAIADAISQAAGGCATLHDKGVSLASAKALARRARAMVAIDSGLRHYAAAFNRPVVALFGPTHVEWTETWHPKEVRLQAALPCGPCQEPMCPTGTTECMWKIKPDEVLDALAEALRRDAAQG